MEQPFDIKADLKELLRLCAKADPWGTDAQRGADEAFWILVKVLDQRGKDGQHPVNPGRFVRLPAKDSYAYYVVTRVTKKSVKLTHIPYGRKYESTYVRDGEADIDVIERTLGWYDQIESRFALMGKKPFDLELSISEQERERMAALMRDAGER